MLICVKLNNLVKLLARRAVKMMQNNKNCFKRIYITDFFLVKQIHKRVILLW